MTLLALAPSGCLPSVSTEDVTHPDAVGPDGPVEGSSISKGGLGVPGQPGTLDTTFGAAHTGLARVSFGSDDGGGFYDLDVVGNQIVAAGQGFGGLGGIAFAVTRLTSSGAVDPGFAMGTLVKTRFEASSGSSSRIVAVGHQSDGRIIAMGWHEIPSPANIALQRYGVDGSTGDPLFGVAGKSLLDLGGSEQVADGVVLSNDKIIVVGQRDNDMMVARVTLDGRLDTSFAAPNGYQISNLKGPSSARSVVVDSQDRILVLGHTGKVGQRDLVVVRYLQDGQPDMTFGTSGRRVIEAPGSDERAAAAAVLDDGRILVAGDTNANGNIDFQVRRLLADGSSDPSFGVSGVATLPMSAEDDSAEDMVVLPDGKILLVGNVTSGIAGGPVLARTTRNGKLDSKFGTGGVLSLYVGDNGSIHCAAVYPGNKVVIGGGDEGGSPGPGTFGIVARMWM